MRRTHATSVHVCEKQSQVLHKSHEKVVEDDMHQSGHHHHPEKVFSISLNTLLKLEVFSEDKLNALL